MKNLFIILCLAFASCAGSKVNKITGEKTPTKNTQHFIKVYGKYGAFHTGKKLVPLPGVTIVEMTKNKIKK